MKENEIYRMGVDVGSTTMKIVILDAFDQLIYKAYRRHLANVQEVFTDELGKIAKQFSDASFRIIVTGSAGMGIAERMRIPFIQEVVAAIEVTNTFYPETRTLIDLGGEDAKMVFFKENRHPDIRMNGSCAGGTGAFIDQMASLMNITVEVLGKQALRYAKIYPMASRCGVFAKTDVQNLISRNVPVADVSASILNAVALQTVTTLSRGYDAVPKVLCIGGPLTFIPALRDAFKTILKINDADLILPENGEFFPALGAALHENKDAVIHNINSLLGGSQVHIETKKGILPALFRDEQDYGQWKRDRKIKPLKFEKLGTKKQMDCFLGIDSGSTTTKIVITDTDLNIVYSFYGNNEGNSLRKTIEGLNQFFEEAEREGISFTFLSSAATGYGEDLIRSALGLDYGVVETMAHLSGAQYVDPNVSFVLDIGGQDIKSIFTYNSVISNIELNEACSAGCGSFLQNFASTMNKTMNDFAKESCLAQNPSDLGSRCTVFMNSKVKQSLREGAGRDDISAGLAYSVVKNCLFKVLKISNLNQLGNSIVVQGGTFRNDAVYRALELLSGKTVASTDHPELMGALGAALYARKRWSSGCSKTGFTGKESLPDFERINTKEVQCKGCTNHCSVLRFAFDNGNICYAGNKCEKMFHNTNKARQQGYNAFDMRNQVLFERSRPSDATAVTGITIGIPRVLNMFDNYPFWHTLFTECGFTVKLSPESTYRLYQKGVGSVMSDNICFPAKLAHGHILSLVEEKVDRIFYPIVPKEEKEFNHSSNSFNCPVVSGYPDVIRSSIDPEGKYGIPFDKPVITLSDDGATEKACFHYLSGLGVSKAVFKRAFSKAIAERDLMKKRLGDDQKAMLDKAIENKEMVFIVAGRPYHTDPLIHQKVGQILSDLGVTVLTDDVFRTEESAGFEKLNMVSQWSYPNRVVQAAMEVAKLPQNVQLVQLNSFGCGPDSFFMDETRDILKSAGKNITVLRIDEIASPGSIRLRLRSLIESLKAVNHSDETVPKEYQGYEKVFTEKDKKKTILIPWFTDFISPFIPALGELTGYTIRNLPKTNKTSADLGLMYGNNEVCYPSTLILGDIIQALQSGEYDPDNVVIAISQTGGQCRATNYISQIKYGLQAAGFSGIPVIAAGAGGKTYQSDQSAFNIEWKKIISILFYAALYGDALNQMYSAISIREKEKGDSRRWFDSYIDQGVNAVRENNSDRLIKLLKEAVENFNAIPTHEKNYSKVGLVGEIYVKYNNYGQAFISDWMRQQGVEVVTPPIFDFFMQSFVNDKVNQKNGLKRVSLFRRSLRPLMWMYINAKVKKIDGIMKKFRFYSPSESIYEKAEAAAEVLSLSNQFGEGWLIAGEVAHYARKGINKVVCLQPFGCIANHIVAKGIEKRVKKIFPDVDLLYLDIDGGIADVNLQNRLYFMMQ